jgi:hypothetical protein
MKKAKTTYQQNQNESDVLQVDAFKLRREEKPTLEEESQIHVIMPGVLCDTEARGHETPQGRSPLEIVVDASAGFIPLWTSGTILRWRFRDRSMNSFANPEVAKSEIRNLFGEALLSWGAAAPIRFTEDNDVWDFEIVMRSADECSAGGCVLASAFFPDAGRHEFVLYPKLFTQIKKEQVDTFIHEIGHIFGLRHFFANVSENAWPSEIFGVHDKFSIMNYGDFSELTDNDKNDLKILYQSIWTGALTQINGTPIKLVKPYSVLTSALDGVFAINSRAPMFPQLQYKA